MAHRHFATARIDWIGRCLAVALLLFSPGCFFGISANPFRIGNLPANDIVRTHGKPSFRGYYRNFDPAAVTLTVTPLESVNQVRKQHVLIATVCDKDGNGRRNRRVEWHVSGVGHIVEVDESGIFPGRGYLVDDNYAVSYTNYRSHTITRGNEDPSDDIQLKPGQTWCVITSPEEGDTHVTCYAPGIYDWDKHKVFSVKHWVDAAPVFPPCATNATGQPHPMTTRIVRTSDGSPASGYRVRYRLAGGPPAVFEPGGAQQVDVLSDAQGNASVVLRQLQPQPGLNQITIDVTRPGNRPTDKEILIGRTVISKNWVAPQLAIQKSAPPTAVVGQPIPFQILVTNTGTIATQGVTIRDTLPQGLQLVGSNPPASLQGTNLFWSFGALQPQQSVVVQFACSAPAPGTIENCAEAAFAEGISGRSCSTTQVLAAALAISKTGPPTGLLGQPLTFQVTVTNLGSAPATNVVITDAFDAGFVHETGSGPVQLPIGTLAPGQGQTLPIVLTPQAPGRLCNRVTAVADGGLTAAAEHCVDIVPPQISIDKEGPRVAYVGSPVEFVLRVRNTGTVPIGNLVIRDPLAPQLRFQEASDGGTFQGNQVIWGIPGLAPGQEKTLRLMTVASQIGNSVCNEAVVAGDGGLLQRSPVVCVEIRGVAALLTELIDRADPVAVGGETTYTIQVTNQGSLPIEDVVLECEIPEGMEFVDAEGAVPHRHDPNTGIATFEPFRDPQGVGMAPGKRLTYQVQVRAIRPGSVRFRASVRARNVTPPIIDEESTTIYDPRTGDMGAATPNATPGRLVKAIQSTISNGSDTKEESAVTPGTDAVEASDEEPTFVVPEVPKLAPEAPKPDGRQTNLGPMERPLLPVAVSP